MLESVELFRLHFIYNKASDILPTVRCNVECDLRSCYIRSLKSP